MSYIQTFTGGTFDFKDVEHNAIRIEDIARALSHLCRFNGHTSVFYSVAEHSLHVAHLVRVWGGSEREQFAALLHDAAEAYVGDLVTPIKWLPGMHMFNVLEGRARRRIFDEAGIEHRDFSRVVEQADAALCRYEAHRILPGGPVGGWCEPFDWPAGDAAPVLGLAPQDAERRFLGAFNHYRGCLS